MLAALGLDEDTEAVYTALAAQHEGWDIEAIARHLGLTTERVRTSLDRLAELALLRESFDASASWRVVSPSVGLTELLRRQEDALLRRQGELAAAQARVSAMIDSMAREAAEVDSAECRRLVGIDAIQAELEAISTRARTSVSCFMPGGAHSAQAIAAALRNDARVLARGVGIRTICLDSVRNHPPTLDYARSLSQAGGFVRTVPTLPMRMILVDGETALVPADAGDSRAGAVVLRLPGAVLALQALFTMAWEQALPLGLTGPAETTDGGLTPQERELLRLLSEGLTDNAVAGRLGISLSTVRRSMARLMEQLGARSRFEAGLRAAQQGWL